MYVNWRVLVSLSVLHLCTDGLRPTESTQTDNVHQEGLNMKAMPLHVIWGRKLLEKCVLIKNQCKQNNPKDTNDYAMCIFEKKSPTLCSSDKDENNLRCRFYNCYIIWPDRPNGYMNEEGKCICYAAHERNHKVSDTAMLRLEDFHENLIGYIGNPDKDDV